MLKKSEKIEIVDKLGALLKETDGIALASFQGVTVRDMQELKKKLREIGGTAKVYKNRLLKLALKNSGFDGLDEYMKGNTMLIASKEDIVSALKIVVTFAKGNEKVGLKAGVVSGQSYGKEDIIAISKLPGQKELIATIAGDLNAVVGKFAGVLNAIITKFVGTIEAVEKKEKSE